MNSLSYAAAGVDVDSGDEASKKAYHNAKKTFASRKGLIGAPFALEGGFSGALDMGDFLLVQNDDGVGTKIEIAEKLNKFETLGQDLVAMVADDAICVGAEVISLTNTIDTPKVDPQVIEAMTEGLSEACQAESIVIPGGEIAELGQALNGMVWNATAVGVVKHKKFITGKQVEVGSSIVGLKGRVLRSNGLSLARKIAEVHLGKEWVQKPWKEGKTWGEILLTPSKIFHRLILDHVLGDFNSEASFNIQALAHITGGGIPGNLCRVLPEGLGASLPNLHKPHQALLDLQKLGDIEDAECYRTWHCGTAMMLVLPQEEAEKLCQVLNKADAEVEAQIIGTVTDTSSIELTSQFTDQKLTFPL